MCVPASYCLWSLGHPLVFVVSGLWSLVTGPSPLVPGPWFLAPCSWSLVPAPFVHSPWSLGHPLVLSSWPHRRSSTCQVRLVPLPNQVVACSRSNLSVFEFCTRDSPSIALAGLGVQCTDKVGDRWFAMWPRWILTTG